MTERAQIAVPRRATAWRYPWMIEHEAVRAALGTLPYVATNASAWRSYFDIGSRAASHHARQTDRSARARGYHPNVGAEPWLDALLFAWADAMNYRVGRIASAWIAAAIMLREGKAGELIPGFKTRIPETSDLLRARIDNLVDFAVRDSFTSLLSGLNRVRQADAKAYIWRTMLDGRVRPEHRRREGVRFDWSRPPDDGHPGQAPNCRCHPEPVKPTRAEARFIDAGDVGVRLSSQRPSESVLRDGFAMAIAGWDEHGSQGRWLFAALAAVAAYRSRDVSEPQPKSTPASIPAAAAALEAFQTTE